MFAMFTAGIMTRPSKGIVAPCAKANRPSANELKKSLSNKLFIMGKHIMRAETVPFAASMNT